MPHSWSTPPAAWLPVQHLWPILIGKSEGITNFAVAATRSDRRTRLLDARDNQETDRVATSRSRRNLQWLLAWSGQAEVLEPQQLRSMVAEKLNAGLKLNQ